MAKGSNRIERILDGNVIKESFKALSGASEGFEGESYSVYNTRTGEWKQTWVDNNGGYLDFTGEFDGDKRIFKRKGVAPGGGDILQRMVFFEITDDSFTWDWEISEDNAIPGSSGGGLIMSYTILIRKIEVSEWPETFEVDGLLQE